MDPALHFMEAGGLRFACFDEGRGPLVLLLHGFPDTAHTWDEVRPALAAAGYRAVAPFMRGYAPTAQAPGGDYSATALGRDVLALIDALGERSAFVIGHDWGAFATYAAASLAPERMKKIVTVAIPHPGTLRLSLRTLARSSHFVTFQLGKRAAARIRRDDFAEVAAIYRKWSPTWTPPAAELDAVKEAFLAPGGVEAALGYYWSFRRDAIGPRGAEARRILRATTTVSTLSFFGGLDGALDLSNVEASRRCFSGAYEIVQVPDAGHFVHREAPRLFLDRVLDFLARA